ncbi:MAG TPA: transcriptional regulator [Bacillus sp. (in: firmicutes)]|nr:transcriptional regulator [Bacillus sp. (in: firmicutes)]
MNKHVNNPIGYSSVSQDNIILEHYGLNELNFESIKSYRQRFSSIKPLHPWNGLETKDFLYKIGAWGKQRNASTEGLTLAGLLMFSEERIITEVLSQYFLEYRESLTDIINGNWSKRFTSQDGTWSGNLYDFYFKVMKQLTADFMEDKQPGYLEEKERDLIHSSLHEVLINAIVHADYSGEGGIVIEKEKSFFQFSNPGLLRITPEQAIHGGITQLLNPTLFKMFILIGLCKRAGSGLKSADLTWRRFDGDGVDLIQNAQSERTIVTLSMVPLFLGNNEELWKSHRKEKMDQVAGNNHSVTKKEGKPNSVNKKHNSFNSDLNSYNKGFNSDNNEHNFVNKDGNSFNNEFYSYNKEYNSVNNSPNSVNKDGNFFTDEEDLSIDDDLIRGLEKEKINIEEYEEGINFIETLVEEETNEENEEIESQLWEISEIARRKKRLSPVKMEEIIVQLVEKRPLMLKELASLLERTPDGLRNNYLAKLLSKGSIQLKYPQQPNHPRQAYMGLKKRH